MSSCRDLASDFIPDYYRKMNTDLREFNDRDLENHYRNFGAFEGRVGAPLALRENLASVLPHDEDLLEIGPFASPIISGDHAYFYDILSKSELCIRASLVGYDSTGIPFIDFVSRMGDLSVINMKFNAIVSSHCIEHQPDLIRHLCQVQEILLPSGLYYLVISDRRFSFDHFIPNSNIADVLQGTEEKRIVHTLASLIEHRSLLTHNDPVRHWSGDHGHLTNVALRAAAAEQEFGCSRGQYIDVHAWQFTPDSFREIITYLYEMNRIELSVKRLFPTPRNRLEFIAVLGR